MGSAPGLNKLSRGIFGTGRRKGVPTLKQRRSEEQSKKELKKEARSEGSFTGKKRA